MEDLPVYIPLVFVLATGLAAWVFFKAAHQAIQVIASIMVLLTVQGAVALTGFFTVTHTLPPRFILLAGPPLLQIIGLFVTRRGRIFLDKLDIKALTLLHTVRILVELVLFWLFLNKAVPKLMTFEGPNFDIISGITAPIIYYFTFVKKQLGRKTLLFWNFICLGLLFNIVINAVLSVPTPFQQFGFDQPNIGILHFPFIWLPGFVVPVVLLSHLAAVRQLILAGHKESILAVNVKDNIEESVKENVK